jgi:hypothetical protein
LTVQRVSSRQATPWILDDVGRILRLSADEGMSISEKINGGQLQVKLKSFSLILTSHEGTLAPPVARGNDGGSTCRIAAGRIRFQEYMRKRH